MLPSQHAGFSIAPNSSGQLLKTLQFLHFKISAILLSLLRAHLHGLGSRQLENQFTRFRILIRKGISLHRFIDQLEENLRARTSAYRFNAEDVQIIKQITLLMEAFGRTSGENLGRGNRVYRRFLGESLSWYWSTLCRFASNQACFSDYMNIACELKTTFGCKAICSPDDWRERACAVHDQTGLNSLFARLRISMLDASPLIRSVHIACLLAQDELMLASGSLIEGAASIPYRRNKGRALGVVRDMLQAAHSLSGVAAVTQFRIEDDPKNIDWDNLRQRVSAVKEMLGAVKVQPFFSQASPHREDCYARLSRAQKLIDAVLTAEARHRAGEFPNLDDTYTLFVS